VLNQDNQAVSNAKIQFQVRRKAGTQNPSLTRQSPYLIRNLTPTTLARSTSNTRSTTWSASRSAPPTMIMLRGKWFGTSARRRHSDTYTLKLGNANQSRGTVVDEAEQPIADAKLSFHRFWTGGDEMNAKGEQPDFPNRNATTDSQARGD
jgi:hypothetical protein